MSNLTRRDFLRLVNYTAAAIGLGAVVGPVIAYFFPADLREMPAEPVLVGGVAELPLGSSKTVRFGRYPALIVHTKAGLRAYSAVCTHFACIVKWDAGRGQIACPCHEGYFAVEDGAVIAGPPPAGLTPLAITVEGEEIYLGGGA